MPDSTLSRRSAALMGAWTRPPLLPKTHKFHTETAGEPMFSMFEQMDALHPQEAHWHLPLIGVDPAHQGKGIGSALLSHVLNVCDGQKVLAYLEATSPRNVALYERHGFKAVGSIQAANSPLIIAMLRKPRPIS